MLLAHNYIGSELRKQTLFPSQTKKKNAAFGWLFENTHITFFFQDFCLLRINGVINNKIPKHTHTKKKKNKLKIRKPMSYTWRSLGKKGKASVMRSKHKSVENSSDNILFSILTAIKLYPKVPCLKIIFLEMIHFFFGWGNNILSSHHYNFANQELCTLISLTLSRKNETSKRMPF